MLFNKLVTLFMSLPAALCAPATPSAGGFSSLASIQSSDFKTLASKFPQNCQVGNIAVPLAGQKNLTVPAGQKTSQIAVGRGVQNYTCTNGTYASAGALADLFDVSCLYSMTSALVKPDKLCSILPAMALKALSYPTNGGAGKVPVAMNHFFTNTPGATTAGAISPVFASKSDKTIVKKIASSTAPTDPATNVPWLQLGAIQGQGTLANTVFRINTVNGQPPASCSTEGEQLSVDYATIYWLTK